VIIEVTEMKNLFNAILVAIRKEHLIVELGKVVEEDARSISGSRVTIV
jgi:hypothetical protein